MVVSDGDLVVLACDLEVQGSPLAVVTWVREGVGPVVDSDRVTLTDRNQVCVSVASIKITAYTHILK